MRARDNPFAVSRVLRVRYRLSGTTWSELMDRLWRGDGRGAIVGPKGSGKTTLLEDAAVRLEALGFRLHWIRLSEDRRRLPEGWSGDLAGRLAGDDFVLLDGAEQLRSRAWRRFVGQCRDAGGVLITCHRAGRLPMLHECRTDEDLLSDIAATLLGERDHPAMPDVGVLFERHGGNVREALRELYDRWAGLAAVAAGILPAGEEASSLELERNIERRMSIAEDLRAPLKDYM